MLKKLITCFIAVKNRIMENRVVLHIQTPKRTTTVKAAYMPCNLAVSGFPHIKSSRNVSTLLRLLFPYPADISVVWHPPFLTGYNSAQPPVRISA